MLKKEITFVYLDAVQKQVYELIAAEAEKRGYKTKITNDKFAKCEIGWYCEHVNFPQFSKFSIVMLHDITQQYGNWPDIWLREPWDKYDIGFLPSKVWIENWNQCSKYAYANPRKGVYLTGWPKADRISNYLDESKKEEFRKSIGLDASKPTVLYAPAWENDHKQDEFVQAMMQLDVNILVKQAPWPDTYPDQLKNIKEMYELHKDNPRVIQMDPKTSILDAIMVSDVLVSEESSTMCEAVMMGKPAISVCNWLIPDVTPSRYPADDYDYVIKTRKETLKECVEEVLTHYTKYQKEAQDYSDHHFANIGKCVPLMMDIVDSYVNGTECPVSALVPAPREHLKPQRKIQHLKFVVWREIRFNLTERHKLLRDMRLAYHSAKVRLLHKEN
jgi:hypothetical protein